MGQSRGFYQGRDPEIFLHKNLWELYEFVPPVPIIMRLLGWPFDGRKSSNLLWNKTGFTADWCTLCQNQSTDHLGFLPWKYPFPFIGPLESLAICTSLCNPLWGNRSCVGPSSTFITCLISKFPFSKLLFVFKAVISYNDQTCGHPLIQVISMFLRLFC